MNLVELHDVGVAYDGYEALRHADLEIDAIFNPISARLL